MNQPQMNPMGGVTKEQVKQQLDVFKRQLEVKDRLLEMQTRRVQICSDALRAFQSQFGEDRTEHLTLAWWDANQKRDLYALDRDQSQLLVDNLNAERKDLQQAIIEMETIIKRMDSGIVLPIGIKPKPGFDPSKSN
jgi:hypothetical protein